MSREIHKYKSRYHNRMQKKYQNPQNSIVQRLHPVIIAIKPNQEVMSIMLTALPLGRPKSAVNIMFASSVCTTDETKLMFTIACHVVTPLSSLDSKFAPRTELHIFPFCSFRVFFVTCVCAFFPAVSKPSTVETKFSSAFCAFKFK